jgi:2-(1,2-epoxy-1,2-dihydrophenyl)acetyl-CoA isomerase
MGDEVLYAAEGNVAYVTLNRPDRLNTMIPALVEALIAALQKATDDHKIRTVVLTGAGKAFCAGADLGGGSEPAGEASPRPGRTAQIHSMRQTMYTVELLRSMGKVTIAAITGACAGVGLSWACACDVRLAAASAKFNTAFLTAGSSGDFGISTTLPDVMGPAKALEFLLFPRKIDSQTALEMGLVSEVLDDDQLLDAVRRRAELVAALPPRSVANLKANHYVARSVPFPELLDIEAAHHIDSIQSPDAHEAMRAYLEKRPPNYA